MNNKRLPFEERLKKYFTEKSITECWEWTGHKSPSGYGSIRAPGRRGKMKVAHRAMYEITFGPIPDGLLACHHCDNRLCVNPHHIFLGTIADNNADRDRKGRCRARGLPGEGCGHSKLKNEQVLKIRADKRPERVIAKDYGVTRAAINSIKSRRTWKHI